MYTDVDSRDYGCAYMCAGMGAVLPGAVLPGYQIRAGAHQAGVQVFVCQGGCLSYVLARSGHCHLVMERSVADRGMCPLCCSPSTLIRSPWCQAWMPQTSRPRMPSCGLACLFNSFGSSDAHKEFCDRVTGSPSCWCLVHSLALLI